MEDKKLLEYLKKSGAYDEFKDHLYSEKPLFGEKSPFSALLQTMVNAMLEGEASAFLEEERARGAVNKRNGRSRKTVKSSSGPLEIVTPRDRKSDFEPKIIPKGQRSISSGLDEQILSLYARGHSIEDVKRFLSELYDVDISAGKISQITDKVLPEIEKWRNRPLEKFYPIVYLDAVHFKIRFEGRYESRAFYTVYAINWDGERDLLGIYVQGNEGASRWGIVLEDLKRRGVEDILMISTDNLTGFSEVIQEVFPSSIIQKCIVHQVRNSLKYTDTKDRKKVAADLRTIYSSATLEQAESALESFSEKWDEQYVYISRQWRNHWQELTTYFDYPEALRKIVYTTNPVEALHRIIRKHTKSKSAWVSEQALVKQLYLSLMYNKKSWKKKVRGWKAMQRSLLEQYGERIRKQLGRDV